MASLPTDSKTGIPSPVYNFVSDESLAKWEITAQEWLERHDPLLNGLATGAMVFNKEGRILLIQRASHDSMPNKWEVPGGAVDLEDASLLHAAARELWEESGLQARRFNFLVPEGPGKELGSVFTNRNGTRFFRRIAFEVEVESCDAVKLDPEEHQDFVWATEEEVREQKIGDREIPITRSPVHAQILEAFRLKAELRG